MMFPIETKQPQQLLARKRLLLDYRSERPVAFSAFMATTAAHRAIYYGHHKDLSPDNLNREDLLNDSDFKTAYSDAVRATRIKVQAGETADSDFLDACFSLMSTASMIGNFEEAQAHLSAVKHALQTVELSAIAKEWLPLADNKTAIGRLTRPLVHLPWPRTHADAKMLARVSPRPNTPMARLATNFNSLGLSMPLIQIINNSRITCHLCQLNDSTLEGLSPVEHEMYRRTSIEAEHDLLTYVYDIFPHTHSDHSSLIVPALEQVIRLAVLGLYSTISIHILPASGLGRALTFHHKAALQRWCAETASTQPTAVELRAVAWALFVYVQCAVGQSEVEEFDVLLARINADLGLRVWDEVEAMLYGFLYAPRMQRTRWKVVWEDLQGKAMREGGKARGMLDEVNEGAWTRGGVGQD